MVEKGPQDSSKSIPDPSTLTTDALNREIEGVKDLIYSEIRHRTQLTESELRGVAERFDALEKRTAEQKADTEKAVQAALAAAEKAVVAALAAAEKAIGQQTEASERSIAKSETATNKQIEGQGTLIATTTQTMDDKIADIKDRLTTIESIKNGGLQAVHETRDSSAAQRSMIALSISALLFIMALVGFVITMAQRTP